MNEREYLFFEYIFILIAVLYPLLGIFLLQIFKVTVLYSYVLLLLIFIIFFILSIYCNYKKQKFVSEMMEELKKCLNEARNGKNNNP